MAHTHYAHPAGLSTATPDSQPTSSLSAIDLALKRSREKGVMSLERTQIVRSRRGVLGHIEPPDEDQLFVRAFSDVREAIDRRPEETVKQYTSALHRVWTSGARSHRSTTTMRRAVLGGATASATTHLGLPLTMTCGSLTRSSNSSDAVDLAAAREWLAGVVSGAMGAFVGTNLRVEVRADVGNLTQGEDHVNSYGLTPIIAGSNCDVVMTVHCTGGPNPTVYDISVDGWAGADRLSRGVITALLDAAQCLLVTGRWTPCNAVYVPTVPNVGTMRDAKVWPETACHANVFSGRLGPPPTEQLTARTLVVQYDVQSGVSHGVIAACDVSPSLLVIGGSPNGKGVHYSICRVIVDGLRGHYATVATQQPEQPLLYYSAVRRQPCRKDGLLSPALVNLMTGYGDGRVGIDFVDSQTGTASPITVRTLWSDALDAPSRTACLRTRDPEQAVGSMIAIAMLQGWTAGQGSSSFELKAVSGAGDEVTLTLEYAPTTGPRWLEYLSEAEWVDLAPEREDGFTEYPSELALDYWMSGLARYIMKDHIVAGTTRLGTLQPVVHAHGLFPLLRTESPDHMPHMDIVLHVGKVRAVARGEAVGVYVYALGIALCRAGRLVGTYESLDEAVDDTQVQGTAAAIARYKELVQLIEARSDVRTTVRLLARLAHAGDIRVYGSGIGAAIEQCDASCDPERVHGSNDKLREVGPLVKPQDVLPPDWSYAFRPGDIAAAHAYSSGVVNQLPRLGRCATLQGDELWELIAEGRDT